MAGGYVLRDWTGKVLKVRAANCGHTSILVAVARALKDGVSAAIQLGYRSLLLEGDKHYSDSSTYRQNPSSLENCYNYRGHSNMGQT